LTANTHTPRASAMQSNYLEHPAQGIGEVDFPRASSAFDYGKLISEDAETCGKVIRAAHTKWSKSDPPTAMLRCTADVGVGSIAVAELRGRRRQVLGRNRPPWRVVMASARRNALFPIGNACRTVDDQGSSCFLSGLLRWCFPLAQTRFQS
jgi:hypothetical protein